MFFEAVIAFLEAVSIRHHDSAQIVDTGEVSAGEAGDGEVVRGLRVYVDAPISYRSTSFS